MRMMFALLCVAGSVSALQAEDLTNSTQIEITRTWSQEPEIGRAHV